jgi:hypothetical protein
MSEDQISDRDCSRCRGRGCDWCKNTGCTIELRADQFARYDAELMNGRRAYLAGLSRSANPHHIGSDARDWWQEGYDQ